MRLRHLNLVVAAALTTAVIFSGAGVRAQTPEATPAPDPVEFQLNPDVSGEVEFWHFWASPVRNNAIKRVIAICKQKLPNINVTDVVKPFGDIWTANLAAVAAGSGMPDVIVEDRPKLPQRAADGITQNLQPLIDRDGVSGDAFWPFTWEQTLYEGNSYGIPFETDVRVLFYNRTLFTQAGLDPNDPPSTWEELEAAADALDKQNDDGTFARIAFHPLYGNGGYSVWGFTNGAFPLEGGELPNVNTAEYAETLDWVQTWNERYGGWQAVQDFRATFGALPNDAFMSGKVAMIMDVAGYSSQLNFYRPSITLDDGTSTRIDWGVALLPYSEAPSSYSGGFALSIPTGADGTEAGWEFIKCAAGHEAQSSWARDTYSIPTIISAVYDPLLMVDPNWVFFTQAMESSYSGGPFFAAYANWQEQIDQRIEAVWKGEITAEQALQEAQQGIEETANQ
jgi:multiple sugar transport system substrate-binding protein